MPLELQGSQLEILVLFALTISLSGYVINDIYDVKSDQVNKPGVNMVLLIGKRKSVSIYIFLIFLSLGLSILLAYQLNKWEYIWLSPLMVFLLWLYSRYLKPLPLAGNLFVSVFCTLVILLVYLSEQRSISQLWHLGYINLYYQVIWMLVLYGTFAFITTFIRELIKDTEDIKGDHHMGANTFPVRYGLTKTKLLLNISLVTLILTLLASVFLFRAHFNSFQIIYFFSLILAPSCWLLYALRNAINNTDFKHLSRVMKLIMMTGLLFLLTL